MSADYDYFQKISYEDYVRTRDDAEQLVKLEDIEHGMIVSAYSVNRHLTSEGAAVMFTAELQLNNHATSQMGAIGINLIVYSHTTLQPIPNAEFPVKAFTVDTDDETTPILWQMTGRFPLRTARYGALQGGFFGYWANTLLSDFDTNSEPPQREN